MSLAEGARLMTQDLSPPVLTEVDVFGLFGQFNHRIRFPADWDFVILHGENGVGKTMVLDLIKSASVGNLRRIAQVPFERCRLGFADNSSLTIRRNPNRRIQHKRGPNTESIRRSDYLTELTLTLERPGHSIVKKQITGAQAFNPRLRMELERFTPLQHIGDDIFFDPTTGETISTWEAAEAYGGQLTLFAEEALDHEQAVVPNQIRDLWSKLNVHQIETQRLLSNAVRPRGRPGRPPERIAAVSHFSDDLTQRIQKALSDLGQRSQELDRTFPARLLAPSSRRRKRASEQEIRERYEAQMLLRNRLVRFSVLDETSLGADLQLPKTMLDDWALLVMTEFVSDSEKKFGTVLPLLNRLELLTRILDQKFKHKRILIDRKEGFVIRTTDNVMLRPEQLSSGEQHELVLLYDLLFGAWKNALVLIDEPEISLHVTWQKRFLSDLRMISELTDHRFIIATHSPTLIGRFTDRMVHLGSQS